MMKPEDFAPIQATISFIPPKTKVWIPVLEAFGRINFVKIDLGSELIYNVSYFADGLQRYCDLYPEEFTVT